MNNWDIRGAFNRFVNTIVQLMAMFCFVSLVALPALGQYFTVNGPKWLQIATNENGANGVVIITCIMVGIAQIGVGVCLCEWVSQRQKEGNR